MQGVCTAFFSMSLQLGIIDALPEEHRSEGYPIFVILNNSNLIGPLIAVGIMDICLFCNSDDRDCSDDDILRLPSDLC